MTITKNEAEKINFTGSNSEEGYLAIAILEKCREKTTYLGF